MTPSPPLHFCSLFQTKREGCLKDIKANATWVNSNLMTCPLRENNQHQTETVFLRPDCVQGQPGQAAGFIPFRGASGQGAGHIKDAALV